MRKPSAKLDKRILKSLDALATCNSADLLVSPEVVTTSKYKIPKWISDVYNKVDKNKNGVIPQKDLDVAVMKTIINNQLCEYKIPQK